VDQPAPDEVQAAEEQGVTLVHFSAQRKRFLWDRGWIWELFRMCLGGVRGYHGIYRVFLSEKRLRSS